MKVYTALLAEISVKMLNYYQSFSWSLYTVIVCSITLEVLSSCIFLVWEYFTISR